ncbi:MAG TPA: hypothetical protein VHS99_01825 [Chloroflexota bacterium]|nr:hypothetical protein [Chloroflexota bacterium]
MTLSLESPGAVPLLLFRSTARDESYGRLALAPLDAPERRSPVSVPGVPHEPGGRGTLSCDRVHFSAGSGLCLAADRGVITTYKAIIFDAALRPRHTIPLGGVPSRARVSPDGRYAAMTVFVSGHSYADGGFSTLTTLLDTASGELIADLEAFDVLRDGQRISSPDFNFWGVTFARESNRFYATLGTAGHTYLVEGDVAARQVRILRDGVECPSLSPDNRRIAFKRQVGSAGRLLWQPAVLDLATLAETPLPLETRNVDDQMEWLDDGHLVYGLPADGEAPSAATNLWTLAVDGSAPPRLLLGQAWSPAVIQGRPLAP